MPLALIIFHVVELIIVTASFMTKEEKKMNREKKEKEFFTIVSKVFWDLLGLVD